MFGERMKEQREFTEPRLRQEDVGKILGMSQEDINPTPEEIVKICKFYNVSADYLLGITNDFRRLK